VDESQQKKSPWGRETILSLDVKTKGPAGVGFAEKKWKAYPNRGGIGKHKGGAPRRDFIRPSLPHYFEILSICRGILVTGKKIGLDRTSPCEG